MSAESRGLGTPVPDDTQHPKMYLHGVYILGCIVALAILTLGILAAILREELPNEIVTAFVALGSPAVAGLAGIFVRKATE